MKDIDKRGFTLIELLIVISIIGILVAVSITGYIGATRKAARSEAYANLENLRLLEERFFADSNDYTASAAGVAAIRALLPDFRPGTSLNFNYAIINDNQLNNTGGNTTANPPGTVGTVTPCFVATAVGIAGTRVENDFFAIDCNNNRNF